MIPLTSVREVGLGTVMDPSVEPKTVYWYKVLGVDQTGNISDTNAAIPVSTFTYTTVGPAAPVISSVTPNDSPCRVVVTWTPAFDAKWHSGFLVLRSRAVGGPFRQVGSLVTGTSQLADTRVQRATRYWYRVVALDTRGMPSVASPSFEVLVP